MSTVSSPEQAGNAIIQAQKWAWLDFGSIVTTTSSSTAVMQNAQKPLYFFVRGIRNPDAALPWRSFASHIASDSPRYMPRFASLCRTVAMHRDRPVPVPHDPHRPRNSAQPNHRPRPPNFVRQSHRRVRAAKLPPIGKQEPNLAQQFIARHPEQRSHARILQRRYCQPAPFQNRRQPPRNPRAKSALRIKKQPPSCVPSLPIGEL